jgi:hypothetical protein
MGGESIDVAVLDGPPGSGRVLYAGSRRVVDGAVAVSIDVSGRPAWVVVDPFVRRIDRDRTNNAKRVAP